MKKIERGRNRMPRATAQIKVSLDPGEWQDLAREVNRLAANLPEERNIILQGMRETVESAVMSQYTDYPVDDARPSPSVFSGAWGAGLDVKVRPDLGAITITNNAAHAAAVEIGRGPGPVPQSPIAEWAREKLDLEDPKAIRRIWRKIVERGYRGEHIIWKATNPYADGGTGPDLHNELGYILRDRIERLMRKHGWG
jgi:hypothetical protein